MLKLREKALVVEYGTIPEIEDGVHAQYAVLKAPDAYTASVSAWSSHIVLRHAARAELFGSSLILLRPEGRVLFYTAPDSILSIASIEDDEVILEGRGNVSVMWDFPEALYTVNGTLVLKSTAFRTWALPRY